MVNTTSTNRFPTENDTPPIKLPLSDDELVIAYSMVAALYQLVLCWSQNRSYDERAQSVAKSAEKLLLRTDVMRRILRMAGLERRQEFMADHIELLEQQKQELLKTLHPFAQLTEASQNEIDWQHQLSNMLTRSDFTKAQLVYDLLVDDNTVQPISKPEFSAH